MDRQTDGRTDGWMDVQNCYSKLMHDTDIAILSVCLSIHPSHCSILRKQLNILS